MDMINNKVSFEYSNDDYDIFFATSVKKVDTSKIAAIYKNSEN